LLEDLDPGWREFVDVFNGAVVMQMKSVGVIPVVGAIAGAIAGGVVAIRTPELFASSATILVKSRDPGHPATPGSAELRVSVQKAQHAAPAALNATTLAVRKDDSATMMKLTYLDRDPAQAQRVAERIASAVAADFAQSATTTEIVDAPDLPASPVSRDVQMPIAAGGGIGLGAGAAILLLLRWRRRPASVR
jgi:uncharacterized protein involved in exopolysaccharide biosynthesis